MSISESFVRTFVHLSVRESMNNLFFVGIFFIATFFTFSHIFSFDATWRNSSSVFIIDSMKRRTGSTTAGQWWTKSEIDVFLWIESNNERGNIDDLFSNTIVKTNQTNCFFSVKFDRLFFLAYRMWRCRIKTRAWWILLARPSRKSCVWRRRSRKSSTFKPKT